MSELGLAPLYSLRDFEGSVDEYVERLYWQYRTMVDDAGIVIWGKPIRVSGAKAEDGRDRLFWHLITERHPESKLHRTLSLGRCAHLPRVWDLLERLAAGDLRAVWWCERRRLLVAPIDFSLLVVLQETAGSPGAWRLVTAYPRRRPKARRYSFNHAAAAWLAGQCRCPAPEGHHVWKSGAPGRLPPARQLLAQGKRT